MANPRFTITNNGKRSYPVRTDEGIRRIAAGASIDATMAQSTANYYGAVDHIDVSPIDTTKSKKAQVDELMKTHDKPGLLALATNVEGADGMNKTKLATAIVEARMAAAAEAEGGEGGGEGSGEGGTGTVRP